MEIKSNKQAYDVLQVIKERNYLDKLYERFIFNDKQTMERYNKVYEIAKQYLEEKG